MQIVCIYALSDNVFLKVEEVMLTLKQAFHSAFEQSGKNLVVCELCPMHQLHKLCHDIDRTSPQVVSNVVSVFRLMDIVRVFHVFQRVKKCEFVIQSLVTATQFSILYLFFSDAYGSLAETLRIYVSSLFIHN